MSGPYKILVTIAYQERNNSTNINKVRHKTISFDMKEDAETAIDILEGDRTVNATCLRLYRD